MNIEQWLQLRREGRLSAIPLGMLVSMAASGDKHNTFDMFLEGHGKGGYYLYEINEYVDGNGESLNYHGEINGNDFGSGSLIFRGAYYGNGDCDEFGNTTLRFHRLTQRFPKENP